MPEAKTADAAFEKRFPKAPPDCGSALRRYFEGIRSLQSEAWNAAREHYINLAVEVIRKNLFHKDLLEMLAKLKEGGDAK